MGKIRRKCMKETKVIVHSIAVNSNKCGTTVGVSCKGNTFWGSRKKEEELCQNFR